MEFKEPGNTDELIYFTKRIIDGATVIAWVYREKCPDCAVGVMGKPRDKKTGKVKIRSKEYVCPNCSFTMEKEAYEQTLHAQIKYQCPHCKKDGKIIIPYVRKKVRRFDEAKQKKVSIAALRFQCEYCKENIDVSKKMK